MEVVFVDGVISWPEDGRQLFEITPVISAAHITVNLHAVSTGPTVRISANKTHINS